jgi:hypothetical protein
VPTVAADSSSLATPRSSSLSSSSSSPLRSALIEITDFLFLRMATHETALFIWDQLVISNARIYFYLEMNLH